MLVKVNVTALGNIDYTGTTFWRNKKVNKNIIVNFYDSFVCEVGQELETAKENLQNAFNVIEKFSQDHNSTYVGEGFTVGYSGGLYGKLIHGTFDKGIRIDDFEFKIENITPVKEKSLKWCFENLTPEMFLKEFGSFCIKDLTK